MLQTKDSWRLARSEQRCRTSGADYLQAAKDMTSKEFRDHLQAAVAEIRRRLEELGTTWEEFQPLFSWDNNHSQVGADKRFVRWMSPLASGQPVDLDQLRVPLPQYSPDIHRVIEHIFNRLQFTLYQHMYRYPNSLSTLRDVAEFLVLQFYSITPESISKDVDGLPDVIDWVAGNGGAYPPRRLR
jgi:hypothetical protein